jgi:ubiquinone/menaquinone biosynthesis C-methylase UbiE
MTSSVADQYSEIAAEYEAHWAAVLMPANRQLVAMLPMSKAQSVLDLGGGVGSLVPVIIDAATHAHAVVADRAEGMVRRAPAGSRVVADATRLPFRDDAFDAVVMTFVLQHIDEPDQMFNEAARVLRPGGVIGIAAWGKLSTPPCEKTWMQALDELGAPQIPSAPTVDRPAIDTVGKLEAILQQSGFGRIETRPLEWTDQPDVDQFIQRMTHLGPSRRRLALWDRHSRDAFIGTMRGRLSELPRHAFRDDSEVLAGVGFVT